MPQTQSGDTERRFAQVSLEQLKAILRDHKNFLDSGTGGTRAVIQFSDLSGVVLTACDLSKADLTGAKLIKAKLDSARLCHANLFCADMRLATLCKTDLAGADLRGVSLRGADLTDAYLPKVDVRPAMLARYDSHGNFQPHEIEEVPAQMSNLIARRANLSGAKLDRSLLCQADFTDANMSNVSLSGADLRKSTFVGANLTGATLTGAKLAGAVLTGAQLDGAVLRGADFLGADLRGAILDPEAYELDELKMALMPSLVLKSDEEIKALLDDHKLWLDSSGKEGVRAVLADFDLSGRTLGKLNLAVADLQRCRLSDANLSAFSRN